MKKTQSAQETLEGNMESTYLRSGILDTKLNLFESKISNALSTTISQAIEDNLVHIHSEVIPASRLEALQAMTEEQDRF